MSYNLNLKEFIQGELEKRGVLLRRFHRARSEIHMVLKALDRSGSKLIFDIGANSGQFANECFKAGYEGRIVSVEPQTKAHAELVQRAKSQPNWTVAPRMCIGDRNGKAVIHISPNSVSSSLLAVTQKSIKGNEDTNYVGEESVDISTLDDVAAHYLNDDERMFLKIDTQGYERHVLDGAPRVLGQVAAVYVEMSLAVLYEGGATFIDLYSRLERSGFRCIGLFQGFTDFNTFEMLQVNGLFIRINS